MADNNHNHGHAHGHSHAAPDNPAAHVDNPAQLLVIFLLIGAGTVGTIFASMQDLGDKAIFVHMGIATFQASLVGYFYMHLKKADALTWLIALSGIFFMAILFALPLGDILTRQWGGL